MRPRIFKTRWFARFARREGIADASLLDAITRAERGLIDADLGGGLIKQRVAREGKGRSGGYRTIVAYRAKRRAFFLYGFAKSDQANIGPRQLVSLRSLADHWQAEDDEGILVGKEAEEIEEIGNGEKAEQANGSNS